MYITSHSDPCLLAANCLEQGRRSEEEGDFAAALGMYERAHRAFAHPEGMENEAQRLRGLVWMNRGNALQKRAVQLHGVDPSLHRAMDDAIAAYDEAITVFRALPVESVPLYRNHLGATWLNRGHACILQQAWQAAEASLEQAIAELRPLQRYSDPSYRLNLAGAWTNLAHVLFEQAGAGDGVEVRPRLARAYGMAQAALDELSAVELTHVAFAEMSLRARRTSAMILGAQIVACEAAGEPTGELAARMSDVIDEGLEVARECERRGVHTLRPLALRLFRLGGQLYGLHQPQFLAEFLLENVEPGCSSAVFSSDREFRVVAEEALSRVLDSCHQPVRLVLGTPETDRFMSTVRSLRQAQVRLSADLPTCAHSP